MDIPNFARYYLNRRFSDVTLIVDGERLPAHKVVLSAKSVVFKDLLKSKDVAEVNINNVSTVPFMIMLSYIYADKYLNALVPDGSGEQQETVAQVYQLAKRFNLHDLRATVESSIDDDERRAEMVRSAAKLSGIGIAAGAVGAASAAGGAAAATAGLTAAGFTSSGIAAGSVAAGIQAGIGNVAAGSLFATLQSVGATGGLAVLGPIGLGIGITAAGITGGVLLYHTLKKRANPGLEFYFLKEELSDVKLVVGGEKMPAHKVILSARSSIFESMFNVKDGEEVDIGETPIKPFKIILKYIYLGQYLPDSGKDTTAQVGRLAERFNLTGLLALIN